LARRSDHSKEELENLVIDATVALIEEHQTIKVTARQIAERVGYTPGTLYTHFANLDDIFLHVNARGLEDLRGALAQAITPQDEPQAAIRAMGLAYLNYAHNQPHRFQLMFTPRLAPGEAPPGFLQAQIDQLFGLLAEQLLRIAEVDERTLEIGVRALWSGVQGAASLALSDQLFVATPNLETEIVETLVAQFVSSWPAGLSTVLS
jgi:AcrR family transcriptional regulator